MARERTDSDASPTGDLIWPRPIHDGTWTDADGLVWRMRGSALDRKAARRLTSRPDVAVLHVYGPDPAVVTGPERRAVLDRIEQHRRGAAPPHSDFELAEFRGPDGQVMVVIQEHC